MSIDVKIQSGTGLQNFAEVDSRNRLCIMPAIVPPFGHSVESRVFRDYLRDSTDSNDMLVDGSVTPVEFTIESDQNNDRYIKSISFVIADDGASLANFGAITALTVGCDFFYEDNTGVVDIGESLKTNWDFIRLSNVNPAFGTGTDAFKAKNVEGKTDSYIPIIDFKEVFGFSYGLRLKAGSTQRLVLRINDDVSTIDSFNAQAYGFDRLPK